MEENSIIYENESKYLWKSKASTKEQPEQARDHIKLISKQKWESKQL